MDPKTPEQLEADLQLVEEENVNLKAENGLLIEENEELKERVANLNKVIGTAKGQTSIDTAAKKVEKPVLPEELVEVNDKEYKWMKPTFRLPKDETVYLAATADVKVIAKLLSIRGQKVLVEQA